MTEEHDTIRAARRKLVEGTEVLRTGGGAHLTASECNAVLDELGDASLLVARLEQAERERDEAVRDHLAEMDRGVDLVRQVAAAEALVVRQQEALREIIRVAETTYWDDPSAGVCEIARAALVSLPDEERT